MRHVGDLGNIEAALNFVADVDISDLEISLEEGASNSILDRAIVVHAGEDDLGTGGDVGSLATGNAGGRVACGLVTML